jgi:hypothetical protein
LARARRGRKVQDARVDERERQRACRERRRAGREGAPANCHAPPSYAKSLELMAKLLESWDTAAALSRATLERKIPSILRELVPVAGTSEALSSPLSRATLVP